MGPPPPPPVRKKQKESSFRRDRVQPHDGADYGDEETAEEEEKPFKENLKYTIRLCFNKKIAWILFQMYWSAASIAYFNGMLIPIMDW